MIQRVVGSGMWINKHKQNSIQNIKQAAVKKLEHKRKKGFATKMSHDNESDDIKVMVFVENSDVDTFPMVVRRYMTFRELKYEAFKVAGIPMFLQKWIINDITPEHDKQFLVEFNLNRHIENTLFLTKDSKTITPIKKEKEDYLNNAEGKQKVHKYEDLLKLSGRPLVCNVDCFKCPICYTDIDPGDGAILRSCLHSFCKECLINYIKFSDDVDVYCPFVDNEYTCKEMLQEREIKCLLTTELWEKYLEKSIREAQGKMENVYYCKTPNCKGWCIFEDNVNEFTCPLCSAINCINCRAIHTEYTCLQYQDVVTGSDAETKAELGRMVANGEAMHCPKCKIVIMKKIGCDWLQCSMCKTEICWATRGPRWGPKGNGDTSGGCRCRVGGIRCHPGCGNCH